ncbi:MAG: TatD family hydrolase, partial [Bacteroidales bacterium]|nr:TatD family hydrolase [Bacteroidales bacterium]
KEIEFIDFHTHRAAGTPDTVAVVNLLAGEDVPLTFEHNTLFSAGIHPWYITAERLAEIKTELILTMAHPHVILIGEAGFDQLRGPSHDVQRSAFIFQAELAEETGKPMVIHCVKGWESLHKARREVRPAMNWVIHGFRGDIRLALSLADEGYCFSLGMKGLTEEVLKIIPEDRLLLETDDSGGSIAEVYRHYTGLTGKEAGELSDLIRSNFNNLFKN